jgi:hypothetical protein
VERINTVEAVKQLAIIIRSSGRFTQAIGKMWVKDRCFSQGINTYTIAREDTHETKESWSILKGIHAVGSHRGLGSQNVIVYNNTPRHVYTIGLEDVIVVEMDDLTVICHKEHVQRVKELA